MRLGRIAEVLITVFIGGGLLLWAVRNPKLDIVLFVSGVLLITVIAWWASLATTRGIWAAGAPTVASYLDLSIERCRRNIRAFRWMGVLLLFGALFGLIMGNRIVADIGRWKWPSFLTSLSISVAIVASCFWAGR